MNNLVAVWQSLLKQKREHTDDPAEKKEGDVSAVKAMTETEVAEQHGRQSRWSYSLCQWEWVLQNPHSPLNLSRIQISLVCSLLTFSLFSSSGC